MQQHEVITQSGAIIRYDADNPRQLGVLFNAVQAFGGEVAVQEYNEPRETVLTIMDQRVVGTTLTTSDGTVHVLTAEGWLHDRESEPKAPDYEDVVSGTMPGGWSWSRQHETYESAE